MFHVKHLDMLFFTTEIKEHTEKLLIKSEDQLYLKENSVVSVFSVVKQN